MIVRVGTSGYAYKEWKGSFYPADLKADAFLRFYASRFSAVEINNTFYRMPTEALLRQWSEQVPDDFTFILKAPQRITHMKRLKGCDEEMAFFLRTAGVLDAKLGPILYQLPPNMKKDPVRLQEFLALIPASSRAAFEFRHASWFDAETFGILRTHDAALVIAETAPEEFDFTVPFEPTASWGYLRLRKVAYDAASLAAWARRLRATAWRDACVFFKHEDAGTGPRLAAAFTELLKT